MESNPSLDHKAILEWIHEGASVLDLGCGGGELLALLVQERHVKAQGIEIDEQAIYQCVAKGLAVARMIGHITYMSETSMAEKFRRRPGEEKLHRFSVGSEVEDYLTNRGNHFVKRFDANSYLYITRAIDSFDASKGKNLHEVFKETKAKVLVLAFKSDWLYPASQSKEIVKACKWAGVDTTYCEIDSTYGHDAFLLEVEEETHMVKHFLQKVTLENGVTGENRITEYAI